MNKIRVLITGSDGFIGKNVVTRLNELGFLTETFNRENATGELVNLLRNIDYIIHLAGENRPEDKKSFEIVNAGLTTLICEAIRLVGRKIPIILASSIQAEVSNDYGKSKLAAEDAVRALGLSTATPMYIYRLPGVFGKWSKPNYNSVVATFCYNISHNLPIRITDSDRELRLVYIDDLVDEFVRVLQSKTIIENNLFVKPEYRLSLGDLVNQIKRFRESRKSLESEKVGSGLIRKLYSTYVSFLPPESFSYPIVSHEDSRGIFAEVLRTKDSGQFSFFTTKPGVTRGNHYHHTKTEKFLVVSGVARFKFKHVTSDEHYEIITNGKEPEIVETAPGWAHNITNIGTEEMIVMLWANEVFDPDKPDTVNHEVGATVGHR